MDLRIASDRALVKRQTWRLLLAALFDMDEAKREVSILRNSPNIRLVDWRKTFNPPLVNIALIPIG